jgi:pimeloyl-ACP methyl ester carboxylesterase
MPQLLSIDVGNDATLRATQWPGEGPTVVLLHAGIADRRSWQSTAALLAPRHVVAYDQRGFGESSSAAAGFRHTDDLCRVLDVVSPSGPAFLVGSSMGGRVALDLTLQEPERVAGLVLLAPSVSGAPEVKDVDADTQRLGDLLDAAMDDGDLDEVNRLEMWLWLDGPSSPEGRVGGTARTMAVDMNAALLRRGEPENAGSSDVDAWAALEDVQTPTTVACGDLDLPFFVDRCREIAKRMPRARYVELPGMAHLPYLEDPQRVADLVTSATTGAPAG